MSWQVDWKSQTLALVGGLLHFPGWCSGCLVSEASWETIRKVVVRSGSHEPGFHGGVGDWLLPLLSQLDLLLELQRASACLWWVSSKVWTASTFVIYDFSSSRDVFLDEKECWVQQLGCPAFLVNVQEMRSYTNVAAAQDDAARNSTGVVDRSREKCNGFAWFWDSIDAEFRVKILSVEMDVEAFPDAYMFLFTEERWQSTKSFECSWSRLIL